MLFLFENTLTHYIYIVFYTLISRAHPANNLGNFYAMSNTPHRPPHPRPRSGQLHTRGSNTPNGIRVHNLNRFREADGRALVPGWHAFLPRTSRPRCPAGHPRPPGCAPEYTYKFCLTFTIPMGNRAAVALFWSRFVQNLNSL